MRPPPMHPGRGSPDTIRALTLPHTIRKVPAWTTLLGIALFGLALLWLHHVIGQYRWRDILAHMRAIQTSQLMGAVLLTAAGYGCLTLYDALGLQVRRRARALSAARPDLVHGLRDRPQRRAEYA